MKVKFHQNLITYMVPNIADVQVIKLCFKSRNGDVLYTLHVCHRNGYQGVEAMPLRAAANSIVCTDDNNALLRRLFNMTSTAAHVLWRSSKQCRAAYARCEQCLHHDICQVNGASLIARMSHVSTLLFDMKACFELLQQYEYTVSITGPPLMAVSSSNIKFPINPYNISTTP